MADDPTQITADTPLDNPTETLDARTADLEQGLNNLETVAQSDPTAQQIGVTPPSQLPEFDTSFAPSSIANPDYVRAPDISKAVFGGPVIAAQAQGEFGLAQEIAQPPPAKPGVPWRGTPETPGIADSDAYAKLPAHLQVQAIAQYARQAADYAIYKGADPTTVNASAQTFIHNEMDNLFQAPDNWSDTVTNAVTGVGTGIGSLIGGILKVPYELVKAGVVAPAQIYHSIAELTRGKTVEQVNQEFFGGDPKEPNLYQKLPAAYQDLRKGMSLDDVAIKHFPDSLGQIVQTEQHPLSKETFKLNTQIIGSLLMMAYGDRLLNVGKDQTSRAVTLYGKDTAEARSYAATGLPKSAAAKQAAAGEDFEARMRNVGSIHDELEKFKTGGVKAVSPEARAVIFGIDPEAAGTTVEQAQAYANKIGVKWSPNVPAPVAETPSAAAAKPEPPIAPAAEPVPAREPEPPVAARPEPPIAPAAEVRPEAAAAVEPVASVHDLRPALRTAATETLPSEIIPGEKGQTHQDIKDAELPGRLDNIDKASALLEAEHGFINANKPGEFLSRDQATAKIPGETGGLTSQRLHELQQTTPEGAQNAVQKQSTGGVVQREPGQIGETGSERGGVEQGQQGQEVAPAGTQEKVAPEVQKPAIPSTGSAKISPKSTVAGPFTMTARPVTDLEQQTEMYKSSTWSHVVEFKDPKSGSTVARIRGNVTPGGFQIKGANTYGEFRSKGNYPKIILQLAKEYGSVTSDPDGQTQTAKNAWEALGAELQPDGTYKLDRKPNEQPIQAQNQGEQPPAVEKPAGGQPAGTEGGRVVPEGGAGSAPAATSPRPLSRNEQRGRDQLNRKAHKETYDHVRETFLSNPLTSHLDVVPSLARGSHAFVRSSEPGKVFINPGTFARTALSHVAPGFRLRWEHSVAEHEGIHILDPMLGKTEQNIKAGQELMRKNRAQVRLFKSLVSSRKGPRSLSMELADAVAHIRAGGVHPFSFYQKGQAAQQAFDVGMQQLADATYPAAFETRVATMVDRIRAAVAGEAKTPQPLKSVGETQDELAYGQVPEERAAQIAKRESLAQEIESLEDPLEIIQRLKELPGFRVGDLQRIIDTAPKPGEAPKDYSPVDKFYDLLSDKLARWVKIRPLPPSAQAVADAEGALAERIDENSTEADVKRAYPPLTRSQQYETPDARDAIDASDEPSGVIGSLRAEVLEGTWNRIKATTLQAFNHTFPRTTIADRVSGEKMARWVSSSVAAPFHAADFIAKVLQGTDIDANKFGAALTQDNLDSERVAKSLAGNSKAAQAVGNVVGAKGSPFPTKESYLKFLADPAVQDAIQRHIQMWDRVVEPMFKKAMGIDPATQLPSRGLRTGARVNLFVPPDDYRGPTFQSGGGSLRATMLRKSPFGKEATGTGKYGMNYGDMMSNTFSRQEEIANKNDFEKQLVSSGNAVIDDVGEHPVLEDGEATRPVPYLPGKDLYVRDSLYPEYIRAANVTPSSIPPMLKKAITDPLNRAALAGFTDFVVHLSNIGTALFTAPGVSIPGSLLADTAATVAGRADAPLAIIRLAVKAFHNNQDQLMKLAEIGALREYHTFGSKYNPLTWSGKVIKWADQTVRLVLDDAYKGLVKQGFVNDSETARREFVNRIGQYNTRAQNALLQLMRNTGLGPFATAGTTFNAAAIRTATLSPGVKASSALAAAGLRTNVLMKWIGGLVLSGLLTYYFTGKFHGRPGVPIGNVDTGRINANGQPLSFSLFDWLGLGRAMRVTGVHGSLEAYRKGLDGSEVADSGARDIWNAAISPFWGPPLRYGSALANFTPFIGAPAPTPKVAPKESQIKANLVNATIKANPIAGSIQKYRQGAGLYDALESQFPRFMPKATQPASMMANYPEIVNKAKAAGFIEGVIQQARYMDPHERTVFLQDAMKRLPEPQERLKLMRELKYRRVGQ